MEGHEFLHLNHLSFIGCELESLEGLPVLPKLRILDLSENKLTNVDLLVEKIPNIYHLNLCGNSFETVDQLKSLGKLENLQALDVFDCPFTEKEGYREELFGTIKSLKFLDGFDINNEEADMEDEDGEDAGMGGEDDEIEEEEDEDTEDVGLEYLNSSKVLNEDDNSADYVAADKTNGKAPQKRKLEEANGDVPEKKAAE